MSVKRNLRHRKVGVDEKCVELAEHFLSDLNGVLPEDVQELAESIQRLCEEVCQAIEGSQA